MHTRTPHPHTAAHTRRYHHTRVHTHTQTHVHTYVYTHMYSHTCTHTCTCTHRQALPSAARWEPLVSGIQWGEGADSSPARLAGRFGWEGTFKCPPAQPPQGAGRPEPRPAWHCVFPGMEHPSTHCLSRQPMPVPHCPKQRLLCREHSAAKVPVPGCGVRPKAGTGAEAVPHPALVVWAACPRQCLPDTARHRGQCPPQHSQAPLGAAPRRKIPTLSRELSTTNWSPKSILPAARPLPTT